MAEVRSFRDTRDLLDIISDMQRRLDLLEKSRRIGNTSIDGSELQVRGGNIVVLNNEDKRVLEIEPGWLPTINFYPSNGSFDDYRLSIFGWEDDSAGAALQLSVQETGSNGQDGGKLLLMRDVVFLSRQPATGPEAYISLGQQQSAGIRMQGTFWDGGQVNDEDALIVGKVDIAAGFGAYAHTFSSPFASEPLILYSLDSPSGAVTHSMVATSASGFTVSWSGTTAKTVYFAVFRIV